MVSLSIDSQMDRSVCGIPSTAEPVIVPNHSMGLYARSTSLFGQVGYLYEPRGFLSNIFSRQSRLPRSCGVVRPENPGLGGSFEQKPLSIAPSSPHRFSALRTWFTSRVKGLCPLARREGCFYHEFSEIPCKTPVIQPSGPLPITTRRISGGTGVPSTPRDKCSVKQFPPDSIFSMVQPFVTRFKILSCSSDSIIWRHRCSGYFDRST
jgi:hypothetical protein